jgi:hypothetical protein
VTGGCQINFRPTFGLRYSYRLQRTCGEKTLEREVADLITDEQTLSVLETRPAMREKPFQLRILSDNGQSWNC